MKPFRFLRHVRRTDALAVVLCFAGVFTARTSFADHYFVPTASMAPTVRVDDRIVVNKLAYGLRVPIADAYALRFSSPARGEVVVLESPEDGSVLVKRVVAVPGDWVRVRDGRVELNGKGVPVDESGDQALEKLGDTVHPLDTDAGGGPGFGPVRVPPNKYLVLGDNRGNSHDGRSFGFVTRESILGRASGVFMRKGALTWIGL